MDISVVIPAYNESLRIRATLDEVSAFFRRQDEQWEIVVVNDGSTDRTVEAVKEWMRKKREESGSGLEVRVVSIPHQGKGAAVAAGVMEARGKWVLMTDADLSTPIAEWDKLRAALTDGARVAVGSRQAAGAVIERHQPWARQSLGLLFGRLVRSLFKTGVIDSQCGFKAFEARAAKKLFHGLQARGYCFDVEVLVRARSLGYAVKEVPVTWRDDPDSKVRVLRDWPAIFSELYAIWKEPWGAGPEEKGGGGGR